MTTVRIATWNLENLFAVGAGEGAPTTQAAYDAKLGSLAATLATLEADVVCVQEVGTPEALDELAGRLTGPWQALTADPDSRGIRCGVLTRLGVEESDQVAELPALLGPVRVDDAGTVLAQVGRPALRVRVTLPPGVSALRYVDVVSVHLKSKLLSFPDGRFTARDEDERARYAVYALHRRAAEAATVRTRVTELLDGVSTGGRRRAVVVGGDLNDEVQAATTQILLGPPGSEIGTAGLDVPDRGDAQRLWNLAPLIPEDQRFTRVYRGRAELIDHLLLTQVLLGAVASVRTTAEVPPSVTDHPGARVDAPASDHRPVLVTLGL